MDLQQPSTFYIKLRIHLFLKQMLMKYIILIFLILIGSCIFLLFKLCTSISISLFLSFRSKFLIFLYLILLNYCKYICCSSVMNHPSKVCFKFLLYFARNVIFHLICFTFPKNDSRFAYNSLKIAIPFQPFLLYEFFLLVTIAVVCINSVFFLQTPPLVRVLGFWLTDVRSNL